MKRYPAYKDSGIEWIGQIPSHWNIKRLKYLDKTIMGQSPESTDCNKEGVGIPFLQGNADFSGLNPMPSVWCDHPNKLAQKDDILLSVRAPVGAVNVADQTYGIGRGLCTIRPKYSHKKYSYYRALCLLDELNRIATGSTYTAVAVDQVNNVVVPNSAYDEQGILSNYLDRKTVQIDDLIAKKERTIDLIKEERTAIINQAVTKGLDPKAEMKDSGIEWLGKVPKHWQIKRLKYILCNKKGSLKTGPFGSQLKYSDMQGSDVKVYNQRSVIDNDFDSNDLYITNEKFAGLSEFEVFPGDILLTTRGTIGRCAIFPANKDRGILHPCLIRIQLDQSIFSNKFAKYFIQDAQSFFENVKYNSNATTIDVIYGEKLQDVIFVVPSRDAQDLIVGFLDRKTAQIDAQVAREQKSIELLKEYRTSLISEVVTGKIDVRGRAGWKI